ncbi:MAG TPA: hypothetical protein VGK97_02880, partial [Spongiibacteraceae bacterium]
RNAWGFDWLYDLIFVKPYLFITGINKRDGFDLAIGLIPRVMRAGHDVMGATENGSIRWYIASMGIGAVLVLAAAVLI